MEDDTQKCCAQILMQANANALVTAINTNTNADRCPYHAAHPDADEVARFLTAGDGSGPRVVFCTYHSAKPGALKFQLEAGLAPRSSQPKNA